LFARYFQPLYRELIAEVKRYELPFSFHCCGSVHQVLPLMIDAGIDIFDVVQTSARDMDLESVYRRYGQDICLSGAVDVQKLLVSGSPEQVRAEVRRAQDLWGTRGGLVLGPSHEAAPETPLENILAIYEPADRKTS
jgi:uroporphyrinogen decarboxylase